MFTGKLFMHMMEIMQPLNEQNNIDYKLNLSYNPKDTVWKPTGESLTQFSKINYLIGGMIFLEFV